MSLTKEVFAASDEIQNGRTLSDIMLHLATEHGELAQEVQIASGASYKLPGSDGVVGKGVDLILCALDVIRRHDPSVTEEDLIEIAKVKLAKWKQYS